MASFSTPLDKLSTQTWTALDDAQRALQNAAEEAGFGVRRQSSSNYDSERQPTHVTYCCTRGGARKAYTSKGTRATTSAHCNCTWSACLSRSKRSKGPNPDAQVWRFRIIKERDAHNHPPSEEPGAIPVNRRRVRVGFEHDLVAIMDKWGTSAADVADFLLKRHGSQLGEDDVNNPRRRQRLPDLQSIAAQSPARPAKKRKLEPGVGLATPSAQPEATEAEPSAYTSN